jgi:serine/threonine protein kinase
MSKKYIFEGEECKFIGGGADANVYNYDNKYAIKKFFQKTDYDVELNFLTMFRDCENIIKIHSNFTDAFVIMMELCETSVNRYIRAMLKADELIPMNVCKKMISDILNGVKCMHDANIIHRDLKCENFVFSNPLTSNMLENTVKIIDLATATHMSDATPTTIGTTIFSSPELLVGKRVGKSTDIWTLMLNAFEVLTCQTIFDIDDEFNYDYGDFLESGESSGSSVDDTNDTDNNDDTDTNDDTNEEEDPKNIYYALYLQEKLFGKMPKTIAKWGATYYNSEFRLKNDIKIRPMTFKEFIDINFTEPKFKNRLIGAYSFLLLGLKLDPNARASIDTIINHEFLVQKQKQKQTPKHYKRL